MFGEEFLKSLQDVSKETVVIDTKKQEWL